ncbi:SH3 domain-containing protein [Salinisphaera sp.]|uniref:SH3 domain-containing protein n=1 Tax=Salinisphaera sp. TaxID=1914330 RepID=UPI002D76FB73|nr:SH3 domain-containing protein [Salinisphaera sp.]HET7315372.1 SH3 domain-containing protein [Salinisphaera sp.]
MSARAGLRLAILVAASLVAAPLTAAAAGDAPSAERAQQILEQNRALAKSGDAAAQYNMGVLYDRGYGVERDYDKARQWYKKAAAQHYPRAEHNLGIMYKAGKGVPRDFGKAAQWFRRGADDGLAASQNNLAVLYMEGKGVPRNTGKAAFWAARAAAGGNSAAIDNLPRITADLPRIHVDADDVNVHDQPNREARVVGHADSDAVAVVLARRDDWTQILLPDNYTVGWAANFLLSSSQAPLAGDTEQPSRPASDRPATTKREPEHGPDDKPDAATQSPVAAKAKQTPPPAGDDSSSKVGVEREKPSDPAAPPEQPRGRAPEKNAPPPLFEFEDESDRPDRRAANDNGSGLEPQSGGRDQKTADQTKPAATEPKPAAATHAAVGVDAINVRARASRSGRVIGQLHRGDRVELLDERNGWRYVRASGGMKGWVAGYLLVK